jgi:hypothetical protein
MDDTKSDLTKPKVELEPWQELSILEDIEKTNQPLSEFDFITLASSVPRLYRLKGTQLRELFRLRVKYLKTLPIEKYVQWLRKHTAIPSQCSQDLLVQHTENLLERTHLSSPRNKPPSPEHLISSPKFNLPSPDCTVYSVSRSTSTTSTPSPPKKRMSDNGHFKPVPARTPSLSSSPPTRRMNPTFGSPYATDSPAVGMTPNRVAGTPPMYPTNWEEPAAGIIEDPRRINVDPTRPENNDEFEVELIPQKIVHGYARNIFCVRRAVAPGDHKKFEMTLPPGSINQLLVRCCSRSIHYSKERKFHRGNYCAVSKRTHEQTEREITSDPSCAWIYYLLQFPDYVRLDNSVLSQDKTKVRMQKKGVVYDASETGIPGVPSNVMIIFWEISEDAPGVFVGTGEDDDAAAAAAFS